MKEGSTVTLQRGNWKSEKWETETCTKDTWAETTPNSLLSGSQTICDKHYRTIETTKEGFRGKIINIKSQLI